MNDLSFGVQCALNMEQYDIAQQLREKLNEVVMKLHVLNLFK